VGFPTTAVSVVVFVAAAGSVGGDGRVGVVGANRGTLAVGDSGLLPLCPLGLRGLLDRSSDVVEMVTPTRPLSLSTSAFRLVPAESFSLSLSFSFSFSFSLSFFFSLAKSDLLFFESFDEVCDALMDRSALNAEAILGPAAVAAARQLGGDDNGFSITFFSGSLAVIGCGGAGAGGAVVVTGSFSVSSSLLLLLLELLLEPDSPSSESPSDDDDVLSRLSRVDLPPLLDCCCS
jgi:hypothetical protein